MNIKTKNILKIVWSSVGIIIAIAVIAIYFKMNSPTGLGIVKWVIRFTIGIYSLFLYVGITLSVLLIKWLAKKLKK